MHRSRRVSAAIVTASALVSGLAGAQPLPEDGAPPLSGWHDGFYVRDADDRVRLYPGVWLQLDAGASAGTHVSDLTGAAGSALAPRLFVRRLRPELAGELFRGRVAFRASGDVTQRGPDAGAGGAEIADAWVDFALAPELHVTIGQVLAPFSLENRTAETDLPTLERSLAIRGFVVPNARELGVTLWGDVGRDTALGYEVGAYLGDGPNRPAVDRRLDFMGRLFVRPFAGLQLGVSARRGQRDPSYVAYDVPSVATPGGWVLWRPQYRGHAGRVLHVIPSGAQAAIGGELRVALGRLDLRGEAYWVANDTREAVEGLQASTTERLGRFQGLGWTATVAAWIWGKPFVTGDPGFTRPKHLALDAPTERGSGLEIAGVVSGVRARYGGAVRNGPPEAGTPGGPDGPDTRLGVMEVGATASYWRTRALRVALAWNLYVTPGSGSRDNLASVPANTIARPEPAAHALHELAARVQIAF